MRTQFKETILDLASRDDKVVVILGDIGHYLFNVFQERYPDRFYNMGICETTLISVAAGLSSQGFYPFVHTIAPFITERSLEQIKLDLAYNQFGANIISTGASFDYAWDGATHHCYTDLAILRLIPGLEVMQPGSRKEVDVLIRSQYNNGKPSYFRLSDHPHIMDMPVTFGKGAVLMDKGARLTVMTAGPILANVFPACVDLPVNLVYFHTIKPMDHEVIERFRHTKILVIHDAFGLAEAIHEAQGLNVAIHCMPDKFCVWYGKVNNIRQQLGLDENGIRTVIRRHLDNAST